MATPTGPHDPDVQAPGACTRPALLPAMEDFLGYLVLRERVFTANTVRQALEQLVAWGRRHRVEPAAATAQQLAEFQAWLANDYRTPAGNLLAQTTASTRISNVKSWYRWMADRDLILTDPARRLGIGYRRPRVVQKEHLTLQEATALVQTAAGMVGTGRQGWYSRAVALRNLALVCIGIANGRRIGGYCTLRAVDVDLGRGEIRVEREKGRRGAVLPVAGWAMDVVALYLATARPLLVAGDAPWLFLDAPGTGPITRDALRWVLPQLLERTVRENPDLAELPAKRLSWHSLRVTNAVLLFSNGCDIRSVNELLLHSCLSTTARYTPIDTEDMRQVLRAAHPRS